MIQKSFGVMLWMWMMMLIGVSFMKIILIVVSKHSREHFISRFSIKAICNNKLKLAEVILLFVISVKKLMRPWWPGFFSWGGLGGPPSGENFANPPMRHLSPFLDQGLSPPSAEVCPQKFEYIFVSNLTTFKLKSTLKSCISCLK